MNFQKTRKSKRDARETHEETSECGAEGCCRSGESSDPEDEGLQHRQNENKRVLARIDQGRHPIKRSFRRNPSKVSLASSPVARDCSMLRGEASKKLIVPKAMGLDTKKLNLLRAAEQFPPVTKASLGELDVERTVSNINLRMDVNFDSDLHFQPEEKTERQRASATEYWEALAIEMSIYAFCAQKKPDQILDDTEQVVFKPRLPAMFETLQDVLKTLVPEHNHPTVMQSLDVPLLMQQVEKGVLDLERLSEWLARILTMHCAPMRDEWANRMAEQIRAGFRMQDMEKIASGLETLFVILEAMKLDVANHQIRRLRVELINDTILFLQSYFFIRLSTKEFNVEESKIWYLNLERRESQCSKEESETDHFQNAAVMFRGLTDLLLQFDQPRSFPNTFHFDSGRLWLLRSHIQRLINRDICWSVLVHFNNQERPPSSQIDIYSNFCDRISPLLDRGDDDPQGTTHVPDFTSLALEFARTIRGSHDRNNMVADDFVTRIEKKLESRLSEESDWFLRTQTATKEKLLGNTLTFAKKYLQMSPYEIWKSQSRNRFLNQAQPSQRYIDLEAIAMRLAHIGVLHWRVWGPLLYLRDSPNDI
ncbi:hypothetical protein Egran_04869 [Elaphomyces granulatus]|uniref:T-complex protein 11 n=1 Tax=Elaphomyces granulatus TaxID=519963 RepID=A0A232LTB8_9EURO|nr:hypothetical protein Egran_04869 [Elaphomyces granulatus]